MSKLGIMRKIMLVAYDAATEAAEKEGKNHRDVFALICDYIEISGQLAIKEAEFKALDEKIKEGKITIAMLDAIDRGEIGLG